MQIFTIGKMIFLMISNILIESRGAGKGLLGSLEFCEDSTNIFGEPRHLYALN